MKSTIIPDEDPIVQASVRRKSILVIIVYLFLFAIIFPLLAYLAAPGTTKNKDWSECKWTIGKAVDRFEPRGKSEFPQMTFNVYFEDVYMRNTQKH